MDAEIERERTAIPLMAREFVKAITFDRANLEAAPYDSSFDAGYRWAQGASLTARGLDEDARKLLAGAAFDYRMAQELWGEYALGKAVADATAACVHAEFFAAGVMIAEAFETHRSDLVRAADGGTTEPTLAALSGTFRVGAMTFAAETEMIRTALRDERVRDMLAAMRQSTPMRELSEMLPNEREALEPQRAWVRAMTIGVAFKRVVISSAILVVVVAAILLLVQGNLMLGLLTLFVGPLIAYFVADIASGIVVAPVVGVVALVAKMRQ